MKEKIDRLNEALNRLLAPSTKISHIAFQLVFLLVSAISGGVALEIMSLDPASQQWLTISGVLRSALIPFVVLLLLFVASLVVDVRRQRRFHSTAQEVLQTVAPPSSGQPIPDLTPAQKRELAWKRVVEEHPEFGVMMAQLEDANRRSGRANLIQNFAFFIAGITVPILISNLHLFQ
jgi:hypothetical protein